MLENLLKKHDSFGDGQKIGQILANLEQVDSLPLADFHAVGVGKSTIALLQCLDIVKVHKNRVSLIIQNASSQMPLLVYQLLFKKMKTERLLYDFMNEQNIIYAKIEKCIFIKNSHIPFKFSPIRNLFINLGLFIQDSLIKSQFYIHPDFHDWFCENVIPNIEVSQLANNSLDKLIAQQKRQSELGQEGEEFVLEYEKKRLKNHPNVDNIKIISHLDTSAGYDIQSYINDDSLLLDRFIEVKSYADNPSFYWSKNEVETAKNKKERYYLYLVNRTLMNEKSYEPLKIQNPSKVLFEASDWVYANDGYFFEKIVDKLVAGLR